VVSPDILVVCDSSKIGSKVIEGAPDFVLEIMSVSTYRYDAGEKLVLYQRAGVREYWIINVEAKSILACTLEGDEYRVRIYSLGAGDERISVSTLPGLEIHLAALFENLLF
jgi:Uma2 family endonuclease